jgi:zinc protease
MHSRLLLVVMLAVSALLLSGQLLAQSVAVADKVSEFQLDNGMKILVKPDQRAPIAVAQVWYKVGSSYEHNGITGVSHVLEHMMFKGTSNLGPNEFSEIISANGGRENAFTGRDYTAYFQTLASDRLEVSFKLEADRMQNLLLDENEFKKEVEVVKEERRLRTEDKPTSLTFERFRAAAFPSSPYRNPVIGWMSDLDDMSIEDLRDWYQQWYSPANATLVVVGDVDPKQIYELAKKYYGKVPRRSFSQVKSQQEADVKSQLRLTVRLPAKQPYLIMGYKTPVIGHAAEDWEPYALEVLAAILDGGDSARLSRELVRGQEIAVVADADYSAYSRLPDMLLLDGTPADKYSMTDLENAFKQQIERLRNEAVSEQELQRVVTQVVASKVYEQDSVFYQAMQLGMLETIGLDWQLLDQHVGKLRAVTAEQVQQVAQKYLTDDNLYVAVLEPLPMQQAQRRQPGVSAGGRHGG